MYVLNNRDFLDGLLDVVNLRVWFVETDQEFKDPTKMAFVFVCFIHFGNLSCLPDHLSPLTLWLYVSCTVFIERVIKLMLKTFNLFILCNIHPELFFLQVEVLERSDEYLTCICNFLIVSCV